MDGTSIPWRDGMLIKIIQSKSWFGCPIRDNLLSQIGRPIQVTDWTSTLWLGLDDFIKHPIPSRNGRPIRDTAWMIHPAQSRFRWPIRDRPRWSSKPWHMFVMDWTVSKPWWSGQSYIYVTPLTSESPLFHCYIINIQFLSATWALNLQLQND